MAAVRLSHHLRNAVAGLCIGIFVATVIISFVVVPGGVKAAPQAPDPLHGLIYVHNEHGSYIYLSAAQSVATPLRFMCVPLFVLAMLIGPKKNIRPISIGAQWELDDPNRVFRFTAVAVAAATLAVAYFYGWQILQALADAGIGLGGTA